MTAMALDAMNDVVTGLTTTRKSAPSELPGNTATSHRGRPRQAAPSVTIDVQGAGAGVPDLGSAVEKINKLLALPKGWDGYRAEPVTIEAGIAMVSVLFSVMDRRSLRPQLFPLANGGIQVEWHVGGSSIEIEVSADGHSGCALADGEGEVEVEFSIPILRDELAEFRRILLQFSVQAGRSFAR